jgi:hypothetical protein
VSVHGLCERDEVHERHEFHDGIGMHYCPGQHSLCRNCDDRKCMGCVFREYDHECVSDCPDCCASRLRPGAD